MTYDGLQWPLQEFIDFVLARAARTFYAVYVWCVTLRRCAAVLHTQATQFRKLEYIYISFQ